MDPILMDAVNLYQGRLNYIPIPQFYITQQRYQNQIAWDNNPYNIVNAHRAVLLAKLADADKDHSQWFVRAFISEYGSSAPEDAATYGEKFDTSAEALDRIAANDQAGLGYAGDQLMAAGEVVRAREFWLKATRALDSDIRGPNAPWYLKLAESNDPAARPGGAPLPGADPRAAVRFYLAFLLVERDHGSERTRAVEALKRLGQPVSEDLDLRQSLPFVELCARQEVPEGLAMLGSETLGDGRFRVARNLDKARDYLNRAKALGYAGPLVHELDARR
jgi:tetratricopeptide (TPR) repeat protein